MISASPAPKATGISVRTPRVISHQMGVPCRPAEGRDPNQGVTGLDLERYRLAGAVEVAEERAHLVEHGLNRARPEDPVDEAIDGRAEQGPADVESDGPVGRHRCGRVEQRRRLGDRAPCPGVGQVGVRGDAHRRGPGPGRRRHRQHGRRPGRSPRWRRSRTPRAGPRRGGSCAQPSRTSIAIQPLGRAATWGHRLPLSSTSRSQSFTSPAWPDGGDVAAAPPGPRAYTWTMSIYDPSVHTLAGEETTVGQIRGQGRPGGQRGLEVRPDPPVRGARGQQETYGDRGFTVLGFPCNQFAGQEPGTRGDRRVLLHHLWSQLPDVGEGRGQRRSSHPLYTELTVFPDADGESGEVKVELREVPGRRRTARSSSGSGPWSTPRPPRSIDAIEANLLGLTACSTGRRRCRRGQRARRGWAAATPTNRWSDELAEVWASVARSLRPTGRGSSGTGRPTAPDWHGEGSAGPPHRGRAHAARRPGAATRSPRLPRPRASTTSVP